eukprot:scaffold258455_cov30-Attheya_sp.AAC.1
MKDLVEPESNKATMTSLARNILLIQRLSPPVQKVLDIIRPQLLRHNQSNDCWHEPELVDKLAPDRWHQDLSNDMPV